MADLSRLVRRKLMFHHRSRAFATRISAIEGHLRAIEKELERFGQKAGRHAHPSFAGDQISDAIASILSEMIKRYRNAKRSADDETARFANKAAKISGGISTNALHRIATEVEHRPLVTLAVAMGIGILIGIAGRRR
jgi:ElaB/YqjD/DUF883 family membrane-anchored ribosome-binding protein